MRCWVFLLLSLLISLAPASAFSLRSSFSSFLAPCVPAFRAVRPVTAASLSIGLRMSEALPNKKYNFAPISEKDGNVLGSHRPGFLPNEENEKPGAVDDALVADWASFMKSQQVEPHKHNNPTHAPPKPWLERVAPFPDKPQTINDRPASPQAIDMQTAGGAHPLLLGG